MDKRFERIQFFTLYDLYVRKAGEFREAVNARRAPSELEALRADLEAIYGVLKSKRGIPAISSPQHTGK